MEQSFTPALHLQTLMVNRKSEVSVKKKWKFLLESVSMQKAFRELLRAREHPEWVQDKRDLNMLDGFRVFALVWIIILGSCQYTMSSAVFNPWRL